MKGWLLTVSILLSFGLTMAIQEYSVNFGYIIGVTLVALHFFVIALYFTRKEQR